MTASSAPMEDPQGYSHRLVRLAGNLEAELGDSAAIVGTDFPGKGVKLEPADAGAVAVSWMDFGVEVILNTHGGSGGRWELGNSDADLDLLESIVRAVIAGRVEEVHALGRSRVTVHLADGRRFSESGGVAPSGCLPLPFWKRWGRKVRYRPYTPTASP